MKKSFLLMSVGLSIAPVLQADTGYDIHGSFFSIRPYGAASLMRTSTAIEHAHDIGIGHLKQGFQVGAFYETSTNSDRLNKYFLFNNKSSLIAKDKAPADLINNFDQDILAGNFNVNTVDTLFFSTIKFKPKHQSMGMTFAYRRHIHEHFWMAVEAPVVYVKNEMRLEETQNAVSVLEAAAGIAGDTTVATMAEGFRNPSMLYGRIEPKVAGETRIADVTIRFGYESPLLNRKDLYISPYVGLVVPTGNKAKAKHVFENIVGNGGHFGFMLGSEAQFEVKSYKNGTLWLNWNMESTYLTQNTQKRSFDLYQNGPWSRYLEMWPSSAKRVAGGLANREYGINLMTQDAHVIPGYQGMMITNLNYVGKKWHMSAGYTTFMRQKERVSLANPWQQGPMIAAYVADNEINRVRTIGTCIDEHDEEVDAFITESDINLNSAAHAGSISHLVGASVGLLCPESKERIFEAGATYEFSCQNNSLNRLGVWVKAQITF